MLLKNILQKEGYTYIRKVYLDVLEDKKDDVLKVIKEIEILIEGIFLTRDLVNERSINMYPEVLAKAAKKI